MLEWNLAIGLQSERHARRQMRAIAALRPAPRIVVLVEARQSLFELYISELQVRTGHAWGGVAQGHCPPASWNDSACSCSKHEDEAVMILASLPIVSSDTILCPFGDQWHSARAAVHAAVRVDGAAVHVFGTHLQAGPGSEAARARLDSIEMLKAWAARFESPLIVGGDFNAEPASEEVTSQTKGMASAFADTWESCGSGEPSTYPAWWATRKIDYWFADVGGQARAISTNVARGVWLSDHYPLQATFAFGR
ncbi:MAG: endonuclease/exonuclease/phosphatase family protein [Bacteroidales bacterium]